jgi:hypothetical protein
VQAILWEQWDPIGVNGTPEARTEYDSYASALVSKVLGGASDHDIAVHLAHLETSAIGLGPSPVEKRLHIAAAIRAAVAETTPAP